MTITPDASGETVIDLTGHRCPIPVIRAEKIVREAAPGARILFLSDDPIASVDLPHFLKNAGCEIATIDHPNAPVAVRAVKSAPQSPESPSN